MIYLALSNDLAPPQAALNAISPLNRQPVLLVPPCNSLNLREGERLEHPFFEIDRSVK